MTASHFIQLIFGLLFTFILFVGAYLLANSDRFFGPDPNMPSENGSSRAYTKVLAVVVWLHALALTGAFSLLRR
jgi:hypothetical protein